MNIARCVGCLLVAMSSQAALRSQRANVSSQAETQVRKVYQQVVSRPVGGIPKPERMKSFAPYLSKSLLYRITQARACGDDWYRLNPEGDVKPPFAWLEFGLFSGANDRTGPRTFQIEKTELEKHGIFRVYVRLTGGIPPEGPWTWRVEVIVVQENGHPVIDDVIFPKDDDDDNVPDTRLSEVLTRGCDGSRWVGYSKQPDDPKQQK
jgi:hypothetical protein